jgi:hypothetical protein
MECWRRKLVHEDPLTTSLAAIFQVPARITTYMKIPQSYNGNSADDEFWNTASIGNISREGWLVVGKQYYSMKRECCS